MDHTAINNLIEFGRAFREGAVPPADVVSRLGDALQWHSSEATVRRETRRGISTEIGRLLLAGETAAVVSAHRDQPSETLFHTIASFAYQTSVEWGVIANLDHLVVFNSHWLKRNRWYRLASVPWNALSEWDDVISALTPRGFGTGRLYNLAANSPEPDTLLTPVDDALVSRLDYWREEALRHVIQPEGLDERIQTLFAQFFVLRSVEDRGLSSDVPILSALSGQRGPAFLASLKTVFDAARSKLQSELFESDVFEGIPEFVLSGIIADLYTPHQIPIDGVRYNFAWIDADILGRAYEKYLATVLTSKPKRQLSLWEGPSRDVDRAPVRKVHGVYYTPTFLVTYLTEAALEAFFKARPETKAAPSVADFSCGSGSFLTKAVDTLIRRLRQIDPTKNWGRDIIEHRCIFGIDRDARAVTLARLSLWLRLAEEPDPLPLPRLNDAILMGDSLQAQTWQGVSATFDVILGNPPFIGAGGALSRIDLAGRFKVAQGRFDYSALFVELAVERLASNGILGLVVPNRLFRNRDATALRELLTTEVEVVSICDFGANEVFAQTSSYIGTIIARKDRSETRSPVRYIQVTSLPQCFVAASLWGAQHSAGPIESETIVAFDSPSLAGGSPWHFISPAARATRMKLERDSEPLSSIAGVFQGITVGAKDLFLVEAESGGSGGLLKVRNGLGDGHIIEASLLRPAVYGSEIHRYDLVAPTQYLIYPYRMNDLISESELRESYPYAFRYFSAYRDLLSARGSISDAKASWYELVRRRDERWLMSPKILTRDLATEPSFAVDTTGSTFLIKGAAVVPEDPTLLLPLLGYLNSQLVAQYLAPITSSFRAEFQKFEPQHLSTIPVLRTVIEGPIRDELAALVSEVLRAGQESDLESQKHFEEQIESVLAALLGASVGEPV